MQKSPKNAKIAQNCKNGPKMKKCKNENLPMVTPMMFTDQKLYEIPPKNYKNGSKLQKRPKMGQKTKNGPFFKKDSVKYF